MNPSYDQLIRKLYESVLSDEFVQDILKELCIFTHSKQNVLLLLDQDSGLGLALDSFGVATEQISGYGAYYAQDNPGKLFNNKIALGEWYFDNHELGMPIMCRHPFYQYIQCKYGSHSIMWTPLLNEGAVHAALSFLAGIESPGYNAEDTHILAPLLPHLINAVQLRWRFQELSLSALLGQHLLNRLQSPVVVIDAKARIVFANHAWQDWLSHQQRLFSSVSLAKPTHSATLLMALAKQLCGIPPVPIATIKIDLENGDEPVRMVGLPLKNDHPLAHGWLHPVGIVVVHDPATSHAPWKQLLQRLFGLTRAECRLVEQLTHSHSLVGAAYILHVSTATGRTQLKSIFQKTATSNQSAFIQLVTELSQMH